MNVKDTINYLKSFHPLLFGLFNILYVAMQIAALFSILWINNWANEGKKNSNNDDEKTDKFFRLGIYILIGIIQCIISLLSESIFTFMFIRAVRIVHESLLFSILRSNLRFFEATPSGRILNRFSKDIEAIETIVPERLKDLIFCIYNLAAIIFIISYTTPLFLISLIPISLLYFVIQRVFVKSSRQLKRLDSVSKSPIFSHFNESIVGVSSIRAFKLKKFFVKKMQDLIDENLVYFYPNYSTTRWLSLRVECLGHLVTLFACLFAILSQKNLSSGLSALSILYSLNISTILSWFIRFSSEFEANITSIERINEYCNTPHEAKWSIEETKPNKEWPNKGHVQFINYSLKYREELDFVLKDLNIEIQPCEKIGIVGRTGAGKSSLTLGLFRMIENHVGQIIIDDVDIHKIGLHDLRQKITIIPQVIFFIFF